MHRWITPENMEITSSSIIGLIFKYLLIRLKINFTEFYKSRIQTFLSEKRKN